MLIGMMNNPRLSVYKEIEGIGEAGYDFVDLTIEGPTLDVDRIRVRELLERYSLRVVGHTDPCLPYAYPLDSVRRACLQELERCAEIFSSIGAEMMNIHPCYSSPPSMKRDLVKHHIDALGPIARMAEDHGLVLVLENFKAPFDRISTFESLFSAVPELCLHLDFGHTHIGKDDARVFCRSLGDKLRHVHFSDNRAAEDDHMPLGAGNVDWNGAVKALKAIEYDGTITLEIFCGTTAVRFAYTNISKHLLLDLWNP
jgi:sugar phosphate isomerase/epimerase